MKTSFFPLDNKSNQYVQNTEACIKAAGYEVIDFPRNLKSIGMLRGVRIANLNWYESADTVKNILARMGLIYYLKLVGMKIVFTCHNKLPHNTMHPVLSKLLMKLLCRESDAIVGLCTDTVDVLAQIVGKRSLIEKKFHLVPHVTYDGSYTESSENFRAELSVPSEAFVVLAVGMVRRYKNIDLLLQAAKQMDKKIVFLIAGSCDDEQYRAELLDLCKDMPNIHTMFRFIEDDEMVKLLNTADLVVMPYGSESSLNSGAAIMAMTYGKCVLCPEIGTLKDIPDKSLYWTYAYSTVEEHVACLVRQISDAYNQFYTDPEAYRTRGDRAAKYIAENHSREVVSQKYREIYGNLTCVKEK